MLIRPTLWRGEAEKQASDDSSYESSYSDSEEEEALEETHPFVASHPFCCLVPSTPAGPVFALLPLSPANQGKRGGIDSLYIRACRVSGVGSRADERSLLRHMHLVLPLRLLSPPLPPCL